MLTNSVILTINGRNKMMQQTCDEEKSYPPTIASFLWKKWQENALCKEVDRALNLKSYKKRQPSNQLNTLRIF